MRLLQVDDFIAYSKKQSQSFRTNHIVMTMGEDFHYQDAGMWFKNMDKLIKYEQSLTNLFIA